MQRYSHVVSDAIGYRFYRCGAEYHFLMEPRTEVPIESIDALVGHVPALVPLAHRARLLTPVGSSCGDHAPR